MPEPRGVAERLDWFLTHSPGGVGMCARHSWRALGGDYGCPPRWGAPNANVVYAKVRAAGRYWMTAPPRGALILWRYGEHGHAALSLGDGRIATTDPHRWGASAAARIWTDTYNGVRFPVGGDDVTNTLDYNYSGKPTGTFTATTDYRDLDTKAWDPPRAGLEMTLVYLNVSEVVGTGNLRIRLVRSDGDDTGYHDYPVAGKQLITHTYWELGDGTPTKVQVRCMGGLKSATVTTRYVKRAVVVD